MHISNNFTDHFENFVCNQMFPKCFPMSLCHEGGTHFACWKSNFCEVSFLTSVEKDLYLEKLTA